MSIVETYAGEIDDLVRHARELAGGLTPTQLDWRPAPGRWSVGQNLDHIVRTGQPYLEAIRPRIAEARARVAAERPPLRPGWLGNFLVRSMEPPPRLRVRTFRRLQPAATHDREELLEAFERFHREAVEAARDTGADAWHAARIRSPFFPLLGLTLGQAFAVLAVHGRRHLWQAGEVARAAGFPDAPA
ncbi:MAG: DinB family protein [Gemmatimonadota bacterium]